MRVESFSHEDLLELRRDFYNYDADVLRYLLPLILEDAINNRSGDDIETGDLDRLVSELDPFWLDNELTRQVKLEQFGSFNKEQSRAICEWLRLARGWKDLRRFSDWIDPAIDYWCRRASEA
jgi:hypothetical protein